MRARVQTLGYLVWHLSIRWRVAVDRALSPLGMTHAHYSLMASLYALTRSGGRPSQRELAEFAGLEVVYVSKLVRVLEDSGLLRRRDHPGDPRAFELTLTAQGANLVERAATVMRQVYDQLLTPIGGPASQKAVGLMQTLEGLLDRAEEFNALKGASTQSTSQKPSRQSKKR
jgi:MarR family transcriptional regulator, organic hydroperoxide resistance regulator